MKFYALLFCLVFGGLSFLDAQSLKHEMLMPKKPIVCYANPESQKSYVGAPLEFERLRQLGARSKTATINVTYNNFTQEAKDAFQFAVDVWESLITSDVEINVIANWQPLGPGVLGSAIWGSLHRNFPSAQKLNTWYPAALAEKMAGIELNESDAADIVANFNSDFNWYYSTTGTPATTQYDLITVVMHELGHGLGFVDSYDADATNGYVGVQDTGFPIIYDLHLETNGGSSLFHSFANATATLRTQLTSNELYFNSPRLLEVNGQRSKVYAPLSFSGGSSIAHLDESTYLAGTSNALMTPQVAAQEVNHNPGPIVAAMFSDMGWKFTRIAHQPLKDTENESGPFVVKAIVTSDQNPASGIKLFYSVSGSDLTSIDMTATGNENEYQAIIPTTGTAATYQYYISANDNLSRNYTNPGKFVTTEEGEQAFFTFVAGPDLEAPEITHAEKTFILNNESVLTLDALVTDNLGVKDVFVEYKINTADQSPMAMELAPNSDEIYIGEIDVSALEIGDIVEYRIVANDISVAGNSSASPEDNYFELAVVGLAPPEDSYTNNFNTTTDDFFGDGFSIATVAGFEDGAIHTTHPYPEGNTFPNQELNFVYQLRIPIRVGEVETFIKFDEVVLVEPGAAGTVFGSANFFDYVVVEGSLDEGATWTPIADGYDSRANADWLTRFNSSFEGDNSTATGSSSLFRSRTIDLLSKYEPGDEVAIRFRLFSDPFSSGWGWAIDNLRIQIDENPPALRHDFQDYVANGASELFVKLKVEDGSELQEIRVEYSVNNGATVTLDQPVIVGNSIYELSLPVELAAGDVVSYQIFASDILGNEAVLPEQGSFIVKGVTFGTPLNQYINDFASPTDDFIGNFFNQSKPTGFADNAIHSTHPYPLGFGLDNTSSFQYTLIHPITVDESNPYIHFKEIAVVEGHASTALFPSAAFNDYVVVEGSSDEGVTWKAFADGYDATGTAQWTTTFTSGKNGLPSFYRTRTISMLTSGDFENGDDVLVRFRLFSDAANNGWGWAIDDLSIQGPITGIEQEFSNAIQLFPNPAKGDLTVEMPGRSFEGATFKILNNQGQELIVHEVSADQEMIRTEFDLRALPSGLYFLKVQAGEKSATKKFIKSAD